MSKEASVSRAAYVARKEAVIKHLKVVEARLNELSATLRAVEASVIA